MYKIIAVFFILCGYTAYGQITCNPPLYNGCNTSLATIPVSSTPSVGTLTGAGNIVTDPDFNSTSIMRATDVNTEALKLNASFSVAGSGSGDENHFNCNDDRFFYSDDGGRNFVSQFSFGSPLVPMYIGGTFPRGLFSTGAMFFGHNCPTDAYKVFTWTDSTATIGYYDVTNPAVTPSLSSIGTLKTTNCLGTSFGVTWTTSGETDQFDTDFALGVSNNGGQAGPGAIYVTVYRVGSGCRVLNLSTNTVVGDWGPVGGTSNSFCTGAKIHNVKMYKGGGSTGAVLITVNGGTSCPSGGYTWFYNGLTLSNTCTGSCGGHFSEGLNTYVNNNGNTPPNAYWAKRVNTNTSSWLAIIPALPTAGYPNKIDWHSGWNFLNDSFPFLSSTYITDGSAIVTAWQDEIIAIDPSGERNPIRLAHTQNTGKSKNNFSTWIAVGSVSQSGKYYAFTSDWQGNLGTNTGTTPCTLGTNCRGDVFIAQIFNSISNASSPVLVPNGGMFPSSTSVTLSTISSPTIICYNFTGAPATNGLNSCINSTLYTGPVAINSTTTIYAVAGGVGFLDSPVASAPFVIVPPSGFKFAINGTGSITGTGVLN